MDVSGLIERHKTLKVDLSLTPPPRFAQKRFDAYRIDDSISGQREAVEHVIAFSKAPPLKRWQIWKKTKPGLYLDGDFGVGKTHLLASAYAAHVGTKAYLSFTEAMSLMIVKGPDETVRMLSASLVCIDEFELDDPSNTRLVDLMLDGLMRNGSRILVTSNTVPGDLGQGRFPVEEFRRQLIRINSHFDDVHVPGKDFRQHARPAAHANPQFWSISQKQRMADHSEKGKGNLAIKAAQLAQFLKDIPIMNLRYVAEEIASCYIDGLKTFDDQFSAVRFVHLIDRLYDAGCIMAIRAECDLDDLFHPSYKDLAFTKKFRRCSSRLAEMCSP